jgi:DNA modification methylase
MTIEYIDAKTLKPWDKNPKKHDLDAIESSMGRFGVTKPILVQKSSNRIVAGHGRYEVMVKQKKMTKIPVIFLDLNDSEAKAYAIIDNQTTMMGGWDEKALGSILEELKVELPDLNLGDFDLDEFMPAPAIVEDDVPEPPKVAKSKRGEIYVLGRHRLMCGDATNKDDVARLMDGKRADMVFADPPYGMNLDTDWTDAKTKSRMLQTTGAPKHGNKYPKVEGDDKDFIYGCVSINAPEEFWFGGDYYAKTLPDGGSWFVWDKRTTEEMDGVYGSAFELIWSKTKHKREIARFKWAGIFGTEKEDVKKRIHPTQKPIGLCVWFIDKFSNDDALVLDPFGGSGTTLIACEQTNRICYMMEIDPIYCDVIIARWEKLTGKKAVKA